MKRLRSGIDMLKTAMFGQLQAIFGLPLQQQLLLLGYHTVANLKMCYPKTRIKYHTDVVRVIATNLSYVAFSGLFGIFNTLYGLFSVKISKKMLKSIFSNIAQNDYLDISAVQNGDFDQIQTLSSIFFPKYGLGKILSILSPDMFKTAIFGQFQAIFWLPLQQQLLLLGYHTVADLKMCYPRVKINYHTDVVRVIATNLCYVAFSGLFAYFSVLYTGFLV